VEASDVEEIDRNQELLSSRLTPDERIHAFVDAQEARLLVTDKRLAVAASERLALDVSIAQLRRIQFDIERARPATLVIVPDDARYEAQVLTVPREQYGATAQALAFIGEQLYDQTPG
jgi:hypothetical protein